MSKASKTKKPGAASSEITDIAHEEIIHDNGVTTLPAILTPEEQAKLEIKKFNLADAGIELLKKQYGDLKIAGPEDKDGYKKVREAWGEVRTTRTRLEKKGLELRNGYTVITKAIKKEEDRLIELLSPLEDDLYGRWKEIDEIKEKEKAEKLAAEEAALNARLDELVKLGMNFNNGFWEIGETITVDVATLRSMPEEPYNKLKAAVTAKAAEIQKAAEAAEQKRREEEAERQRQADQLKKEQDELREAQQKLDREREEMQQQRESLRKMKVEGRVQRLIGLGMFKVSDDVLLFDNGFSSFKSIILEFANMDDKEFESYFEDHVAGIKSRNEKKAIHQEEQRMEKEAREKAEIKIAGIMDKIGMVYNYNLKQFEFKNDFLILTATFDQLLPRTITEIDAMAETWAENIAKAKADQAKAEQEKKAAADRETKLLMKDRDVFAMTIDDLRKTVNLIEPNEYKSKGYQTKAARLKSQLLELLKASE